MISQVRCAECAVPKQIDATQAQPGSLLNIALSPLCLRHLSRPIRTGTARTVRTTTLIVDDEEAAMEEGKWADWKGQKWLQCKNCGEWAFFIRRKGKHIVVE